MASLLSFSMTYDCPTSGGRKALKVESDGSIEKGDVGNTFYYAMGNHSGTHVDTPAHMLREKTSAKDLTIEDFVFSKPLICTGRKTDSEMISFEDVHRRKLRFAKADIVLFRTGVCFRQKTAPRRYRDKNPGLSVEAADYLASDAFPKLRAIGIDSISIACAEHVDEGVEAYRRLFRKKGKKPFLIVEDMNLTSRARPYTKIYVVPLFVEGLGSYHCTILGEYRWKVRTKKERSSSNPGRIFRMKADWQVHHEGTYDIRYRHHYR